MIKVLCVCFILTEVQNLFIGRLVLVVLCHFWLTDIVFLSTCLIFLRTLEPSVPTINYDLGLVLEKSSCPDELINTNYNL